jgi:Trypsin-like peptidase domain
MNWNDVVDRVSASIVKIETPRRHGTGFLCFYNYTNTLCGIATAHHVVEHADEWQQPIRIIHQPSKTTRLLRETDRAVWVDRSKDSAVIILPVGELELPQNPIPLLPIDERLPVGVEVCWLGYPGIAKHSLCFFSGNVSAWLESNSAYLIDGVAINGVSGGPVIYSPLGTETQIVGSISAYSANRATGEALPGLSVAQDVSHFLEAASRIRSIDEANQQKQTVQQSSETAPLPPDATPITPEN